MPPNLQTVGQCPKCQGTAVVCRFNDFDRGDLRIHSWEHKCPDCGWRETRAFRSDDPPAASGSEDPRICPFCRRSGEAGV